MRYRFGDWIIDSALTLPELPSAPAVPGSVDFELVVDIDSRLPPTRPRRWLHHSLDINGQPMLSVARTPDGGFLLRFPGSLQANLDVTMRTAVVRLLKQADLASVRHQLIDQLLPRVLAYRGHLPIHASAVDIDGAIVLILGDSGWGKSTLAAALHAQGHRLLSDDCVVLRSVGTQVHACGTYPSLRLLPDSMACVIANGEAADYTHSPITEGSSKRRLSVPAAHARDADSPVEAICILNAPGPDVAGVSTTLLTPGLACIEVMKHSFQLDISDRVQHMRQLRDAGAVATRVPAFNLAFPRDFKFLPEVTAHLKRKLRGLSVARQQATN